MHVMLKGQVVPVPAPIPSAESQFKVDLAAVRFEAKSRGRVLNYSMFKFSCTLASGQIDIALNSFKHWAEPHAIDGLWVVGEIRLAITSELVRMQAISPDKVRCYYTLRSLVDDEPEVPPGVYRPNNIVDECIKQTVLVQQIMAVLK